MSKSEISEKELAELKKKHKELVPRPCYWRDKGESQCDFIPFVHDIIPKLITALEYKKEEIGKLKKENRKLKNGMIEQADKIYYLQRICIAAKEYYDAEMNYDYIKSPGLTTRQVSDNSKEWRKVVEKAKQFQQALRELEKK
ncbi:hypothetical protein ES707_22698 [subsurface metagenome]